MLDEVERNQEEDSREDLGGITATMNTRRPAKT